MFRLFNVCVILCKKRIFILEDKIIFIFMIKSRIEIDKEIYNLKKEILVKMFVIVKLR